MADSWRLKLMRAKAHLEDIEARIGEVVGPSPQAGRVWVERTRHRRNPWAYRVDLQIGADPMLPVVIGDFLFNVRSALDHLAVANVPKRRKYQAEFPIISDNIWDTATQGPRAEELARQREAWQKATTGMAPKVLAVVERAQPYHQTAVAGKRPEDAALAILSAFQNADKHRELVVVAHGLADPRCWMVQDGRVVTLNIGPIPDYHMLRDGALFARLDREVDMEIAGTIKVAMARGPKGDHRLLPDTLGGILIEADAVATAIEQAMG